MSAVVVNDEEGEVDPERHRRNVSLARMLIEHGVLEGLKKAYRGRYATPELDPGLIRTNRRFIALLREENATDPKALKSKADEFLASAGDFWLLSSSEGDSTEEGAEQLGLF